MLTNGLLIQWGGLISGSGLIELPIAYTSPSSYGVFSGFGYYNNDLVKIWNYDESHIITEGGPSITVNCSYLTIGY